VFRTEGGGGGGMGNVISGNADSDNARRPPKDEAVDALSRKYNGYILVCDIDDTLRHTHLFNVFAPSLPQRRVRRALRTVSRVARRGVPVVYLSAAPARWLRATNERFLSKFPRGVLIDRTEMTWRDWNPFGQPESQRMFKRTVLRQLVATYPRARLICLGDNRYGDPRAYSGLCDRTFIRRAIGSDRNVPSGFQGMRFRRYDRKMRSAIVQGVPRRLTHRRQWVVRVSGFPGIRVGR
jgi:hypothetical protein